MEKTQVFHRLWLVTHLEGGKSEMSYHDHGERGFFYIKEESCDA